MYTANKKKLDADFTSARRQSEHTWSIVLAGGEDGPSSGADYIRLGGRRPSQYRCFDGENTLLEQALESALSISGPERLVTLIGHGHARHLDDERIHLPGTVIEQPRRRGTATAAMLCIAYVLARDPGAIVTLLPSDQFAAPRERLCGYVERAIRVVQERPAHLVALGIEATFAETEYGWLVLDDPLSETEVNPCYRTRRFCEKPSRAEADRLFTEGALWNTFIISGTADTFWELAWATFPALMEQMEVMRALFADERLERSMDDSLAEVFANLPTCDLCKTLLPRFSPQLLVLPVEGIQWSDWGRPRRIAQPAANDSSQTLPASITSLATTAPTQR